jgi:DNA-binding PadR family transcriptional regulator
LSRARLSVGAAHAALQRLITRKLLTRGKEGARHKKECRLTDAGREALASWTELLGRFENGAPSDLESILRIAALALVNGRKREALRLLECAAGERREGATKTKSPPKFPPDLGRDLTALYSWMIATAQAGRIECEARALRHIFRELQQR